MDKQKLTKFILMMVFLAVVIIVIINLRKELTANSIKEQLVQEKWFIENCACLEKERLECPAGFELVGRLCKAEGKYTNILKSCSKYDCPGEVYEFNLEEEKWKKTIAQ